eukprot:486829_1
MDEKLNNNNINLSNVDIQMKKNNLFEQQKKINNDEVKGQMIAEQLEVSNGKSKALNALCDNVRITESVDGYYFARYSCSALLLCENEYTKKALLTNGVFDFMDRSKSVCISVQQRTNGWQIPIIYGPALGQIANYICVPRTETALLLEFRDDDFNEEMPDLLCSSSTVSNSNIQSDSSTESESEKDPIDECEHKNDPIYPIEKHVLIDEVKDNDDINYKRVKKMDYRKLRKQ